MKDHAVSDFHRAVRFTGSFNYELPGPTRGALRFLLGGWQLNGIFVVQTGAPLNITDGFDNSLTGIGGDRPDIVGDPDLDNSRPRGERILKWFNTAAYAASAPGTFGNLGRNTGRGPAPGELRCLACSRRFRCLLPKATSSSFAPSSST